MTAGLPAPFKYNPGILGDDALMQCFVVRHKCLELILETLKENAGTASANRHLLVVGPRGIGKTMLVRRAAAEVRSNPKYGGAWFPIVFGEESYQVSSAGEFWLEALVHLSDSRKGRNFDATLADLREERSDSRLRERALAQLLDFADAQHRRLLLVVENLGMLCEQITPAAAWELRHTLTNEPRIMLLATATSRFDAVSRADQAWFELFGVHELKPLDRNESCELWRAVAHQVLKPGHVRAIRILTGGNPRLLTVLAGFAANRSFRELMEQLIHLIDDHTEYFKGHLDGLPAKERRVFVGLLEQWNPVATAELAGLTRTSVNEVSALLNRLVARGAVEVFEDRPRRKVYQAAERLYNIYYLMRRRGQPSGRVRAAVSFMVMFYGGRRLAATIADLAREACGLPAGKTEDHFVAYAELARQTSSEVWDRALERTRPEFFDREDTPEFIRQLPKKLGPIAALERATAAFHAKDLAAAEQALREAIKHGADRAPVWQLLARVLSESGQQQEAERACRKSIELDAEYEPSWRMLGGLLTDLGRPEEAESAFRKATELKPDDVCAWHYLGRALNKRKRHADAERACRRAVELDPEHVAAWNDLGVTLDKLGRRDQAEQAFLRGVVLDPKDEIVWRNLAGLLRRSGRNDEASRAYQTAIDIDPGNEGLWSEVGHFVSEVGPPEEAERVWRQALQLHPGLVLCAVHILDARQQLGVSRTVLVREAAEWIERAGRAAPVLRSMSHFVLRSGLTKAFPRAEGWAKEAAAKDPTWESAHTLALANAAQGKWSEALQTCKSVLDAAANSRDARKDATDFLIQAAAAGYAGEALSTLSTSQGADKLEPLLVGLKIYLGEAPRVAKEIHEIGNDVAERIRGMAHGAKSRKRLRISEKEH